MNHRTQQKKSRRQVIASATAALAAATAAPLTRSSGAETPAANSNEPFKYCLNTSTISGQNLGIESEVELAAKVGFHGIEPWIRELQAYQKKGKSLSDLRKKIEDSGLKVADCIGFAPWIVDDEAKREAALEQARREMDLVLQIGGTHIAAPPAGSTDHALELPVIVERYQALLDVARTIGITPVLELWGFSKTLSKIGEVAYVTIEANRPNAGILLDIYHIYKGGGDFEGMRLLSGIGMPLIHTNDYPSNPPREKINDSFRVYPGDGVAPLDQIFRTLRDIGFTGYLSVELFNRGYWKQSPLKVAKASLEKTRAAVQKALSA
ncbi:MAG TPA: sugar phosphate isomerase/epimerase family protein [Tepidisphaeraceae bacterium]|nr:sugar phosphate isomerase/epimerase family protein [Tepidisphaeraceae bacterium]